MPPSFQIRFSACLCRGGEE